MLTLLSREIPQFLNTTNPMGHTLVSHDIQSTKRVFKYVPQSQLTTQIMTTRALQFKGGEVHLNLALPPTPFCHWKTQPTQKQTL